MITHSYALVTPIYVLKLIKTNEFMSFRLKSGSRTDA